MITFLNLFTLYIISVIISFLLGAATSRIIYVRGAMFPVGLCFIPWGNIVIILICIAGLLVTVAQKIYSNITLTPKIKSVIDRLHNWYHNEP